MNPARQQGPRGTQGKAVLQENIAAVELMPDLPEPFELINWREKARSFEFTVGPVRSDLYDVVSGDFLKRDVRDQATLKLSPDTAAVIVVAPRGGQLVRAGNRTLIDNVVVAWR